MEWILWMKKYLVWMHSYAIQHFAGRRTGEKRLRHIFCCKKIVTPEKQELLSRVKEDIKKEKVYPEKQEDWNKKWSKEIEKGGWKKGREAKNKEERKLEREMQKV